MTLSETHIKLLQELVNEQEKLKKQIENLKEELNDKIRQIWRYMD